MTDVQALAAAAAPKTVFDDASPELARTYSEALLNAAGNAEGVESALADLEAVESEVLGAFPAVAAMMNSPTKGVAEKDATLVALLQGKVSPTVVNFLRVLNRHGRFGLLGPIARAARVSWDRRQNRTHVTVRSAVPLDDAQLGAIRDRLAGAVAGTPVLKLEVDPGLLGGLVVQVGDDVYDASVRNSLERLRNRLSEGNTHEVQSGRNFVSDSE